MKLELEQLEDIKSTITWFLENGDFKDTETAYNSSMNSLNTLDEAINYSHCCKSDSEQLCEYCGLPLQEGVNLDYCKNDYCTRND